MYLVDRLLQLDALALVAGGIMLGIRWYRTRNSIYMVAAFAFLAFLAGVLVHEWGVVVGQSQDVRSPVLDVEVRNGAVTPFFLGSSILRMVGTAGLVGSLTSSHWRGALRTVVLVSVGSVVTMVGVLAVVYLGTHLRG